MYSIIRKVSFLVGLTLCVIVSGHSQVVTSTRDGLWTDPTLWDGGFVPTVENASQTVIDHDVTIPDSTALAIGITTINSRLTVGTGAVVNLMDDGVPGNWDLQVFGVLVLNDGATLNGTSLSNTSFESGARYIHLQGPLGFIPYATWNYNATFEIAGFRSQGYINIAHSDSWKQSFGHVVYNCAQQTTAFVDLNGYLRNIAGDFIVQSTNNHALRLSTTQNPVISIGGNFTIEGPSKVWFSTTPSNAVVNIQGDFRYRSSSSGISYFTTRGMVTVNISGEMEMNSPGRIHMATTSADSTGIRQSTLSLKNDLTITNGVLIAPPSPGKGKINFVGPGIQTVITSSTGSSFQGNLDYGIESGATVNLGNSVLSNTTGSLLVRGTLQVGSSDPAGAIQVTNGGNIYVQGDRIFENGSTVEYNGMDGQWIGNGHPTVPGLHVVCSNASGVNLLQDIVGNDFTAAGPVNTQLHSVSVYGDFIIAEGVICNPEQLNMLGDEDQLISSAGATVGNLTVNKSGGSVNLISPLTIRESLVIESTNTALHSNGHLLLLSTSDELVGTASIGPLPAGSSITGDVTVQRHMAGEGRIYRYISSPIQNGTVASLKDDFPITGRFQDPSTGSGIQSSSPSFYYYDESIGGLQEGWLPYPTSGLASENPLSVGKGYAAFIRRATASTIWDVTGPLNQGSLALPVTFTPANEPSNGWNLVGNPYACAIQWDEAGEDKWTMQNISSVIAIRDNGNAGGTFTYWDMDENYSEIPGGQIATGQSFWVRATGTNPALMIHEGAKVLGGATFFRKEKSPIPSFAIRLTRGHLVDVAYYKVRPFARPGLDDWDGLKLENDNFDISFVSSDQRSMAIHATDQLPCDTVIQLGLKDLKPGTYKISLMARYEFSRYDYTILDKFLGTETILSPDQTAELMVTADTASSSYDRISIRVVERKPIVEKEIMAPLSACIGNVVTLIVKDAEAGITYTVWEGTKLLSSLTSEVDGDLKISFPADSLSTGKHTMNLKAQSACYNESLTMHPTITINTAPQVWADSVVGCRGASVVLHAFSDRDDATFTWYVDEHSTDTLATGDFFEPPPLVKSMVYFVLAGTPFECTSQRYPVGVTVRQYVDAKISLLNDSILVSNHATNNTWYFNETKIEGTTAPQLVLDLPGVYTLAVDTLECISTDNYLYVVMHAASEPEGLCVYPNPAEETLFIPNNHRRIACVEVFNAQGILMWQEGEQVNDRADYAIPVRQMPDGNYFAVVTTLDTEEKRVFRFVVRK